MAQVVKYVQATIPNGANSVTVSQPSGYSLRAIITPPSFEGTTIAFGADYQANGTTYPIMVNGVAYTEPTSPEDYVAIQKPDIFIGANLLKLTNQVAAAPSNVTAARTLTLIFAAE